MDEGARAQLGDQALAESSRREALRIGAFAGGSVLAGFLAGQLAPRVLAAPGDGIPGTTISDTDIDAKRIAGVRIATEFAPTKHAGTVADPWPGSAIQSAMADLPTSGGMVFLPAGVYSVGSPLSVPRSDVVLTGAGDSTYLRTDGSGFTPNVSGMIEIDGAFKGIVVEGLALDGTNTDTCRGILITGGADVRVSGCYLLNWKGTLSQRGRGVTVVHNPNSESPPHKSVLVENCYFSGNQIGAVFHRTLYVLRECLFENEVWDGVYSEGACRGVVANNIFQGFGRNGVFIIFTQKHIVTGNQVEDGAGAGISLYQAKQNSVLSNRVERCTTSIELRNGPAEGSDYNVVANNIIQGAVTISGSTGNILRDNIQV
ncbi:MAG: right-handed parallel beta-helix repeat-containing protein [Methanobacteriota archaeon]